MQIKSFDIIIPEDEPFKNDLLDREKYAENLTSIITKFNDGLVLAIDGQWGSGKTTFIKMWDKYLLDKEITTLHFNAWENDYQTEVLPALISKLSSLIKDDSPIKSNLLKNAGKALFSIGSAVIDHKLGEGFTKDLTKIGLDQAQKVMERAIANYEEKKKTFEEFKKALEKFTDSIENKPIVFFIDELDRCKPSYAVEVLELVKHLFSVKGIVFVIATDKEQLANSIRGYYGSDLLDGKNYLERIFDLEFILPKPPLERYAKHLYKHYGFDEFYQHKNREGLGLGDDRINMMDVTAHLFHYFNFSLRTQHRIFAQARLVVTTFQPNYRTYPQIIITLLILKYKFPETYMALKEYKYKPEQLLLELERIFPDVQEPNHGQVINISFVLLIRSYLLAYQKLNLDYKFTITQDNIDRNTLSTKYDFKESTTIYDFHRVYDEFFVRPTSSIQDDLSEIDQYIERVEFVKKINLS
jgi:ABC-type ATPase involved in cell division